MSKMSGLHLEIQERLAGGQSPEYISNWLEIPITWVYAVQELNDAQDQLIYEFDECYDPFNTVNS